MLGPGPPVLPDPGVGTGFFEVDAGVDPAGGPVTTLSFERMGRALLPIGPPGGPPAVPPLGGILQISAEPHDC